MEEDHVACVGKAGESDPGMTGIAHQDGGLFDPHCQGRRLFRAFDGIVFGHWISGRI